MVKRPTTLCLHNMSAIMHCKGLWATLAHHGEVIDAFIPIKKSSRDKRFCFDKVVEESSLCTEWGTGNEDGRKKKHQTLSDNRSKERKPLKLKLWALRTTRILVKPLTQRKTWAMYCEIPLNF
ncbi:hypothetical protein V6N13_003336 [Hibiscus sabdariffa]